MKTKFSRILGVGLTIVVLASMLVVSTPASAGTLGFSSEGSGVTLPIDANTDVVDIAAAGNGTTVYEALSGTGADLSSTINGIQALGKSTNGGATWTAVNTGAGTVGVTKVAVAPDLADGSFLAIIASDNTSGTPTTIVQISSDGGATWATAPAVPATPTDIAVSSPIGMTRSLGVVTASAVYTLDLGGIFGGTWVNASVPGGTSNMSAGTPMALAFSPNFPGDRTLAVVTDNGADLFLQLFNKTSQAWNGTVYAGWGTTGIDVNGTSTPVGASPNAVSLALSATFLGADAASRIAYVGFASAGVSGLFRVVDTASASLTTGYKINSVAVNKAGDQLVAGAYDSNAVINVVSPATATSSAVTPATKRPAGPASNILVVAYAGANVVVGSSGPESAVSQSADNGKTFVDISSIDTTFTPTDFSVAADGSVAYVASVFNGALSVFAKTTAWQRVMAAATSATDVIVRTAPDNAKVVFVAEIGGSNQIYYTNDGGATTWLPRYSPNLVTDMAIESASIVYILSSTVVSKSIDSGFIWDNPKTNLPSGVTGTSITFVSAGNLIVGGSAGDVSYSTDANVSWTKLSATIGAGGAVVATADKLASGGNIYAASKNAGTNIYRWTTGNTTTSWTSMLDTTLPTGGVVGIGMSSGTLYAVTYDSNLLTSALYRTLSPATAKATTSWAVVDPVQETTTVGTNNPGGFYNLTFNNGPQNLDVSVGADKNPKIWALSISQTTAVSNRTALESFTDILTTASPAQSSPADQFLDLINAANGAANNVVFNWSAISGTPATTTYKIQIALDSAFTQQVYSLDGITTMPVIVGPTGSTVAPITYFPFQSDTVYYWRVKVSGPVDSVYSAARSFKIDTLKPLSIVSPASGSSDVPVQPTFVWSPVTGATTYEIVVSDDPTFKIITFSRTTDKPEFASDEALAYSTVYYWRVRASAPAASVSPFINGIFTTVAKPLPPTTNPPPVTVTNVTPTVTVNLPPPTEAIPAYFLWLIIGIGAILVIALIVLIVRTRRSA